AAWPEGRGPPQGPGLPSSLALACPSAALGPALRQGRSPGRTPQSMRERWPAVRFLDVSSSDLLPILATSKVVARRSPTIAGTLFQRGYERRSERGHHALGAAPRLAERIRASVGACCPVEAAAAPIHVRVFTMGGVGARLRRTSRAVAHSATK